MSGVPKELDETAYIDGYSFPQFFFKIFIPAIAAGIGVAAFFCFMFSWVELLLAKTLTAVDAKPIAATMTRTVSTAGYELGLLSAAGTLTIMPGAFVIYFVRNYIAKGFALGGYRRCFFLDGLDLANCVVLHPDCAGIDLYGNLGIQITRRWPPRWGFGVAHYSR